MLSERFSCWLSIPAHHKAPIRLHTGQLTRGLAEGSAASPVQPEQPRSCPQPARGAHLVLSTQHPCVLQGTGPRDASVQLELDKMHVAAGLWGAEEGLGIRFGGRERERERERDVCTSSRGSVCACARCQLPVSARVSRHRAQVSRIQAAAGRGCPEPVATASSILLLQGVFLFPSLAACFLLRFLGWRGEKSGTGLLLQLLGFNAHSFQDCVHLLHVVQVALDLQAKRSLVSGEAVGNPAQFHPLSQKPPVL